MKIKSAYKNVYFENWETPVMYASSLWLSAMLQTINSLHFFFRVGTDSDEDIHVMTIERLCPLRMTDEQFAYGNIGKYTKRKYPKPKKKNTKSKICCTKKLWNTSFIKKVDEFKVLSGYTKERNKDIFEYLVVSQDEWIEFISFEPPEWTLHKKADINKLLLHYMDKAESRIFWPRSK